MRAPIVAGLALALVAPGLVAQVTSDAPAGKPVAVIDLGTSAGIALVHGAWRYSDAQVVPVEHREPGPDLRASGAPNHTLDIAPHAGPADFDDSGWPVIPAESLQARRGHGRLSFNWYRTSVTIPARVGDTDPTGMTVVFELVVDDYAEVWVDGKLPVVLGQAGGQLVKGFNAPNRVVLTHDARPGQTFQLAVFGMNGPVSNPPANFIWVRSATLDFHPAGATGGAQTVAARIRRLDPALDGIVPAGTEVEKLAGGFEFTEGPLWVPEGGYLLFSDPNTNTIYRWNPDGQVTVYRTKSGYAGVDVGRYHQPGSNGLALDAEGRVVIDQHGNRRVLRVERTGATTVLADTYEGKRLNSPNDLVFKSDGSLYFTDPPFGLPKVFADPGKETPWSGVYRWHDGQVTRLDTDLTGPNGIAFSPDERVLYVSNWDPARKVIMRYDVQPDGTVANGRVFYDITRSNRGDDAWDGLKVDLEGHVFAAGPEGIYVLSPEGRLLGVISLPEHVANFAWGDADRRSLFITASTGLYRLRVAVPGTTPFEGTAAALK